MTKEPKKKLDLNLTFYVGIGIALGVVLGAAWGNVGMGIAIGIVVGAAIGVVKSRAKHKDA